MVANFIISISTIVFSLFFLFQAFQIEESSTRTAVGADFWPLIILLAMLILGIVLLIKTFIEYKKEKAAPSHSGNSETASKVKKFEDMELEDLKGKKEDEMEEALESELKFPQRLWWFILILVVYIIVIPYIGFTIPTVLLFLLTALTLGMRKWYFLTLFSVVSTAVFVFVFTYFLNLPLPRGIGIFREMSLLIY